MPRGVACYAAAAVLAEGDGRPFDGWVGDGLVPLRSALGQDRKGARALGLSPDRTWIGYGVGHQELLSHPEIYQQLLRWLADRSA